MKFYFVQFTHNSSGKIFYKFGITSKNDVLERFNKTLEPRYSDFNIRAMFSAYGTQDQVEEMEQYMLSRFPKNMYLEHYLGVSKGTYNGLSGITEIVALDKITVNKILKELYDLRDGYKL